MEQECVPYPDPILGPRGGDPHLGSTGSGNPAAMPWDRGNASIDVDLHCIPPRGFLDRLFCGDTVEYGQKNVGQSTLVFCFIVNWVHVLRLVFCLDLKLQRGQALRLREDAF